MGQRRLTPQPVAKRGCPPASQPEVRPSPRGQQAGSSPPCAGRANGPVTHIRLELRSPGNARFMVMRRQDKPTPSGAYRSGPLRRSLTLRRTWPARSLAVLRGCRCTAGFTLIELLVVIAIIALLAALL